MTNAVIKKGISENMLKAYITFTSNERAYDFSKQLFDVMEKNGFECTNSRDIMDYELIRESICESDVYITFSSAPDYYSSFNAEAEAKYAISSGVPVVVIKMYPNAYYLGRNILIPDQQITVYDVEKYNGFKELPGFVRDHIAACREDEDSIIQAKLEKPYEGEEAFIFISYAHKDRNKVFEVIHMMQEEGYRIWYDEGINPASEWDDNIAEHIKKCSCLIAFISGNYINSVNCKDEIKYARDLNKERLLVYLEDTKLPAGMAMRLMRLQAIHKYKYNKEADFYDKLFSAHGINQAHNSFNS